MDRALSTVSASNQLSQLGNVTTSVHLLNNRKGILQYNYDTDPTEQIKQILENRLKVAFLLAPPEEVNEACREFLDKLNHVCCGKVAEQVFEVKKTVPIDGNFNVDGNAGCPPNMVVLPNSTSRRNKLSKMETINERSNEIGSQSVRHRQRTDGTLTGILSKNTHSIANTTQERLFQAAERVQKWKNQSLLRYESKIDSANELDDTSVFFRPEKNSNKLSQMMPPPKVRRLKRRKLREESVEISDHELTITRSSLRSHTSVIIMNAQQMITTRKRNYRSRENDVTNCSTDTSMAFVDKDPMRKIIKSRTKTALSPFYNRMNKHRSTNARSTPLKRF